MGSYLHNLGDILRAFFNCKSCRDVRNTACTEVTCFQTSSFLLVCMVNLCDQLEHELNLHREIFRTHVKLTIMRISIAMNRIHPQKNAQSNGKCDSTFCPVSHTELGKRWTGQCVLIIIYRKQKRTQRPQRFQGLFKHVYCKNLFFFCGGISQEYYRESL